jgi:hypothetical protein
MLRWAEEEEGKESSQKKGLINRANTRAEKDGRVCTKARCGSRGRQ